MRSFLASVVFVHVLALSFVAGGVQPLRALSAGEQSLNRFLAGAGESSVDGTLLIGGKPAPASTALSFHRGGRHWYTKTGADGRFQVDLGDAGRYTVNLNSAEHPVSDLVSEISEVTLSPASPVATITLPLSAQRGTLRLVDVRGKPIARAEVRAKGGMVETPPGSGFYALRRVPRGEQLLIAAEGFLPACVMTALPKMSVTLASQGAHTATIRPEPAPSALFGEVAGLPGSECPVPLAMLPVTKHKDGDALAI